MYQELSPLQEKLYEILFNMSIGMKAKILIPKELGEDRKIVVFLVWLLERLLKDKKEPTEEEVLDEVTKINKTPFLF